GDGRGHVDRTVTGKNDAGDPSPFGRTQKGTQIARIGDAVTDQEERRCSPLLRPGEFVELGFGQRCGEGQNTLWCIGAGGGVELVTADLLQNGTGVGGQLADLVEDGGPIHVGRQPDLLDRAAAGQQEFANRLAPFDLLTTEALSDPAPRRPSLRAHGLQCSRPAPATTATGAAPLWPATAAGRPPSAASGSTSRITATTAHALPRSSWAPSDPFARPVVPFRSPR